MTLEQNDHIVYFKNITSHEKHLTWLHEIIPQIFPEEPVD
jgi:hypothetical protein